MAHGYRDTEVTALGHHTKSQYDFKIHGALALIRNNIIFASYFMKQQSCILIMYADKATHLFQGAYSCENRKNVAQCRKKPSMYLISVRNYYKLSFDIIADYGMRANEIGWQLVMNRLLFRFRAGNAAKAWNTGRSFERQIFG